MKTYSLLLSVILVLGMSGNGEAFLRSMDDYYHNIDNRYDSARATAEQAIGLLHSETPDYLKKINAVLKKSNHILNNARVIDADCQKLEENVKAWRYCKDRYVDTMKVAASLELATADYVAGTKHPILAKKLYRSIITSYTGTAYQSYVKKAEFALEDLKDKQNAPSTEE